MRIHGNSQDKISGGPATTGLQNGSAILLIALFVYTALAKLLDFNTFRAQMLVQHFPARVAVTLAFALPPLELAAAALLISRHTRPAGFWLSFILLFQFTGYAALALLRFFPRTPCACGGMIGQMSWPWHLVCNSCFLALSFLGIIGLRKERRSPDA